MDKKPTEKDMAYLDKWTRRSAITHGISDERLIEICNAERDGRCVVLPQKTVFELTWDAGPGCDMACPVSVDVVGQCDHCEHGKLFVYERYCKQEHLDKIGTTVFLTREAAEAALKGEQHENQT